jgi:hypothetical protein
MPRPLRNRNWINHVEELRSVHRVKWDEYDGWNGVILLSATDEITVLPYRQLFFLADVLTSGFPLVRVLHNRFSFQAFIEADCNLVVLSQVKCCFKLT